MQIFKPTFAIYLDKRRSKKDGTFPLKLRVTLERQQKYYNLGYDVTEERYIQLMTPSSIKNIKEVELKRLMKELSLKLDTIIVKAHQISNFLSEFSFQQFENEMFPKKTSKEDVYAYYETIINKIKKDERFGTASSYQCSLNSIRAFRPKLSFRDVDVQFLKDYERWLIKNGKSISTVGIYLRPFRAVLNAAINDGLIRRETNYPFGKRQYIIPSSRNIKKALNNAELKLLYDYIPVKGSWWEKAQDFFFFSYYGNGMNIKDILLLKQENIDGDYLRFRRAKTINTNRANNCQISIYMNDEMKVILDKWMQKDGKKNDYVFPYITLDMNSERQRKVVQQFTKMVNKHLKDIVREVGIEKPVTSYYARHSFATMLKRSGFTESFIGESIGHTSESSTKRYLDSFEDEQKKEASEALTRF